MPFIVNFSAGQDPRKHANSHNGTQRKFSWWIPLLIGVVVVIAGLGLVLWPFNAATSVLVLLFGAALIANGFGLIVRARAAGVSKGAGILLILLGVFAMVFAEFTVNALVTFVGVTLIFVGVIWLLVSAKLVRGRNIGLFLPPALLLVGGIVALVWPVFAIKVVAVVCGLLTIAMGASMIWTAQRLRRMPSGPTTLIVD